MPGLVTGILCRKKVIPFRFAGVKGAKVAGGGAVSILFLCTPVGIEQSEREEFRVNRRLSPPGVMSPAKALSRTHPFFIRDTVIIRVRNTV
jgi:hypothetical protein